MDSAILMALVGAGGALATAGTGMVGAGVALALSSAFPQIPLAGWLALVGAAAAAAGLALMERGGKKTVQKVESELAIPNVVKNFPWASASVVGVAAFAAFALARRSRQRRRAPAPPREAPVAAAAPEPVRSVPVPASRPRMTLAGVFAPLVAEAATSAAKIGLAAAGVPTLRDVVSSLFRSKPAPSEACSGQREQARRPEAASGNGQH